MDPIPLGEIISDIKLENFERYLVLVIIFTIAIRIFLSFFKVLAIRNGEVDQKGFKSWKRKGFKHIFWNSFLSNSGDIRIDDYWLPAIIGFFEMLLFPYLMFKGLWAAIIAWIVIKTASSWSGWQKTRTAYNRFLVGIIFSLSGSAVIFLLCLN